MRIYYQRLTVALIQSSDGFTSTVDFYQATVDNRPELIGFGQTSEEAATDLLRKMFP